jgi:hypothetical protein
VLPDSLDPVEPLVAVTGLSPDPRTREDVEAAGSAWSSPISDSTEPEVEEGPEPEVEVELHAIITL